MAKSGYFKINLSFYIVILLCLFFQVFDIFFYTSIFVFLHELAHIFTAKFFGISCKKIIITPIGQVAILDKIERLSRNKKLIVVSAGVILNLIFALIFSIFTNEKMQLIKNINLSIAFFNILPIYPLDGGRFLQYYLGSKIGDLRASFIIKKISKALSFSLFLLGFFQMFLLPYNITLFCLGLYFIKINKNEYIKFTFEFYKNLIEKNKFENYKIMSVKEIAVHKNTINKDIMFYLGQDYTTFINIAEEDEFIARISEKDFLQHIERNGLNGIIYDIYVNNIKKG